MGFEMENYPGSLSFVNSYLGVDTFASSGENVEKSDMIRIVSPEIWRVLKNHNWVISFKTKTFPPQCYLSTFTWF